MAKKTRKKRKKSPSRRRLTITQVRALAAEAGVERAKEVLRSQSKPRARALRAGVLVAEGDSWFDYPFNDILEKLEDNYGYDVESVAHMGDTVEEMAYDDKQLGTFARRLRKLVRQGVTPKAVLLSGGGNDIAGEQFSMLLNHERSGLPVLNEDVLRGLVDRRLDVAITSLVSSVAYLTEHAFGKVVPIVLHGYAYPVPDGRGYAGGGWILPGPWLEPGFRVKGYLDLTKNTPIMKALIDRFNTVVSGIASRRGFRSFVSYVDLRAVLSNDLRRDRYKKWWTDELHPTKLGFEKIGEAFQEVLSDLA